MYTVYCYGLTTTYTNLSSMSETINISLKISYPLNLNNTSL